MEGFSDLIWLLIMFLVISRGLGAARRGKQRPPPSPEQEIPGRSSRPAEPTVHRADQSADQIQSGPGQKTRAGRRSDPVTGFRRRLMEAAQGWEAEQRRRAGVPVEDPPRTAPRRTEASSEAQRRPRAHPSARPRPAADRSGSPREPRRKRGQPAPRKRSRWETREVTPDRVAEQHAMPQDPEVSSRRPPAKRSAITPPESVQMGAGESDVPGTARPEQQPLARLERFRPLKRAVVLADILGLPRALSDDPSSGRGSSRGPGG